ncbi:hypothetical protein WS69_02070 [Burkholderia sp. BDU5]|nr:hypothetical protein WS69_02070 [Burkholderia sp. BDU5]
MRQREASAQACGAEPRAMSDRARRVLPVDRARRASGAVADVARGRRLRERPHPARRATA